jgi:hypothetical protein
MAFVIDGAEWRFDGWSADDVARAIDNLLDRVQTAHDRDEIVWIGDDLQTRPMLGELDLWSLRASEAPISLPQEIWQELSAWLLSAQRYFDEEEWPDSIEDIAIEVDGALEENPDLAWAHHNVRTGRAVACLGLSRLGPHETRSSRGSVTIHWVQNENSHRDFWRAAIAIEGDNENTLRRLAPHAYPDLHFFEDAWSGLNKLTGGYLALRSEVQRYLAVLDSFGSWVFTAPPPVISPEEITRPEHQGAPSNQIVERRFRGLGLDMAPEKPNVYANPKCRRAREVTINSKTLYCEWHGKLEPHRNRLHIHPAVPETNGKVIIAIFHEHLPLPG